MKEYCVIMATPCKRFAQVEYVKAADVETAKRKAKSRWTNWRAPIEIVSAKTVCETEETEADLAKPVRQYF